MKIKSLSLFLICASLMACHNANTPKENEIEETTSESKEESNPIEGLDLDAIIEEINAYRVETEAAYQDAKSLTTESLRPKIKQKWSKIDFYLAEDDELRRIKTYPYDGISQRTEEFYFMDGELVLAVVEDNGEGERGKSEEQLDKLYYYYQDTPIKEIHNAEEQEYSVKDSDAEELLSEAKEYLQILKSM